MGTSASFPFQSLMFGPSRGSGLSNHRGLGGRNRSGLGPNDRVRASMDPAAWRLNCTTDLAAPTRVVMTVPQSILKPSRKSSRSSRTPGAILTGRPHPRMPIWYPLSCRIVSEDRISELNPNGRDRSSWHGSSSADFPTIRSPRVGFDRFAVSCRCQRPGNIRSPSASPWTGGNLLSRRAFIWNTRYFIVQFDANGCATRSRIGLFLFQSEQVAPIPPFSVQKELGGWELMDAKGLPGDPNQVPPRAWIVHRACDTYQQGALSRVYRAKPSRRATPEIRLERPGAARFRPFCRCLGRQGFERDSSYPVGPGQRRRSGQSDYPNSPGRTDVRLDRRDS